jgi:hypothetical protein
MNNTETLITLDTQDRDKQNKNNKNKNTSKQMNNQCYQSLCIVHSWLPLLFSLTFICPVSCVPNVISVSVLFILDYPFSFLQCLFVLCLVCPMLPVSLYCSFLIANNTETLITLGTQDTGQINVRENRRGNQEWTIQRHWQHWTHKTQNERIQSKQTPQHTRKVKKMNNTDSTSMFICPVSCVSNVTSVSVLFILDCPFCFL